MPQNQAQHSRLQKKILFVSGKGGVGKSLIAAAIAREQVEAGRRTLLVEIGDNSYYKDFWRLKGISATPGPVPGQGFDLAIWSGESCLREYVLFYLKLERLYHLFFENRVMRALINVAPGLNEIAILGKITSGIRKVGPPLNYDVLVVDCYATGHALALLEAPKGMMEAIKFGPMGHHSREMEHVIQDPALCGFIAVTLLEEMPVMETLEFRDQLKSGLGVDCEIIANKVMPLPVSREELRSVERAAPEGLGEFARYLEAVGDRQAELLALLKERGAPPTAEIPWLFTADANELVNGAEEAL